VEQGYHTKNHCSTFFPYRGKGGVVVVQAGAPPRQLKVEQKVARHPPDNPAARPHNTRRMGMDISDEQQEQAERLALDLWRQKIVAKRLNPTVALMMAEDVISFCLSSMWAQLAAAHQKFHA
jgi:hypothetical protein